MQVNWVISIKLWNFSPPCFVVNLTCLWQIDCPNDKCYCPFLFYLPIINKTLYIFLRCTSKSFSIFFQQVIDLLNPGSQRKPLSVRWSKKSGGFFVENLFTVDCEELDDLLAVLEEGKYEGRSEKIWRLGYVKINIT